MKTKPDIIINYGFTGKKIERFRSKNRKARNIPIINEKLVPNKLTVLNKMAAEGVRTPDSKVSLTKADKLGEWLEKRFFSGGGFGIKVAERRKRLSDKYYQRIVKDRLYELRVHAFSWIDKKNWRIQKRLSKSPDSIAWNFKQGGYFVTINNTHYEVFKNALDISEKVLKTLRMEFGAVDFIVDSKRGIYFIEINSQPGFNGLSDSIYINAFNKVKKLDLEYLVKRFKH